MVKPATDYQTDGYDKFMADLERKSLKYSDDERKIVFTIHPFYGNSSFCIYINEIGVGRVLSNNEDALKGYVNATNQKAANQKAANQKAANQNAAIKNASNQNASRQNVSNQKAPLSPAGDVWIARMDGEDDVTKADPNQADAYHKFMSQSDPKLPEVTYKYPDSTTITISTYKGRTSKLSNILCQSVVEGNIIILSNNFKDLEGYHTMTKRMRSSGGNRTKRSKPTKRTKRSKRVHTAKRK